MCVYPVPPCFGPHPPPLPPYVAAPVHLRARWLLQTDGNGMKCDEATTEQAFKDQLGFAELLGVFIIFLTSVVIAAIAQVNPTHSHTHTHTPPSPPPPPSCAPAAPRMDGATH